LTNKRLKPSNADKWYALDDFVFQPKKLILQNTAIPTMTLVEHGKPTLLMLLQSVRI